MRTMICALAAGLMLAASAFGDDSSASLSMGGIVFTNSTPIRMAAEDLYISPKAVRIRFAFANDTGRDVETVVAFPLPDIDTATFWGSPLGTVTDDPVNFVGFKAVIDGKPVPVTVEQRAFFQGRDVTDLIVAAGAPVNPAAGEGYIKLGKLPPDARKRLADAGLVEGDADEVIPQWQVRTKFYWTQRFPAHRTVVIEHSYQPVSGQSFFSPADAPRTAPYDGVDYCIDEGTWSAIEAKSAASRKTNIDNNGYLAATRTDYILTTANNWNGPIGRFHLTLDKLKPDNVLSLCWDGELKKTGPTTFEAVRKDFSPKQDIHMLVLGDLPTQ